MADMNTGLMLATIKVTTVTRPIYRRRF